MEKQKRKRNTKVPETVHTIILIKPSNFLQAACSINSNCKNQGKEASKVPESINIE